MSITNDFAYLLLDISLLIKFCLSVQKNKSNRLTNSTNFIYDVITCVFFGTGKYNIKPKNKDEEKKTIQQCETNTEYVYMRLQLFLYEICSYSLIRFACVSPKSRQHYSTIGSTLSGDSYLNAFRVCLRFGHFNYFIHSFIRLVVRLLFVSGVSFWFFFCECVHSFMNVTATSA